MPYLQKYGKEHRSWSVVERRRFSAGSTAHRHVRFLGEISDSQRLAWEHSISVFDEDLGQSSQLALLPDDRTPCAGIDSVQLLLNALRVERPRQWGTCWLADELLRTLPAQPPPQDRTGARVGVVPTFAPPGL